MPWKLAKGHYLTLMHVFIKPHIVHYPNLEEE